MEVDNEVSGNGNSYTTEFRQYDPRLGRWKSLDPLMAKFPSVSPYVAFDNNPVYYVDPTGLYSVKKANRMAARGKKNGYDTKVVENPNKKDDFGVYFKAERAEGVYSKTQYDGKFRGIGRNGLTSNKLHKKGFQTTNVETGDLHIVKLDDSEYEVGGTAPDIGIGKGIKLVKWGWKGLRKIFTKGAAKATVKKAAEYSNKAKKAFLELGAHASHTSIKKGVATVRIGFTKSATKENLTIVENALKANGATSVKVLTGKVKSQYKTVLNHHISVGKAYKGYKVQKSTSPLHDFKLTKIL